MSTPARLAISARPALRDHLHGAWWPASTDITQELAPMLQAATPYASGIIGVSLIRSEWPGAPLRFRALSTRSPTINWYGLSEPHLAVLQCSAYRRLILLVVPPDTPEPVASIAMSLATTPGNSLTTSSALTMARTRAEARRGR